MREILFRGKLKISGEWAFSKCPTATMCCGAEKYDFIPETVGQFAGLYDSTKWDDLTDAEKLAFYKQHYIGEDGMSVRFQHIDDVKHLWKGKKIFEGDIVAQNWYDYNEPADDSFGEVVFCEYDCSFSVMDVGKDGIVPLGRCHAYHWEAEVIGNIHDNPDLLKGGAVDG